MSTLDDPASRLKEALAQIRKGGANRGTEAAGLVIKDSLHADSTADAVGLLHRLLHDTEDGIRALDGELTAASYLVNLRPISAWLGSLNLTSAWKAQVFSDERAVAALDIAGDALRRSNAIIRVDDGSVQLWQTQIRELLTDVQMADLDSELRQFLLSSLRGMQDALDDYSITGGVRLAQVIEQALGRFGARRPATRSESGLALLKTYVAIVGAISMTLGLGTQAVELSHVQDAYQALCEDEVELEVRALNPGPAGALEAGDDSDGDASPESANTDPDRDQD